MNGSGVGEPLLSVKGLAVSVATPQGRVRVLDDVSFDVPNESVVALVGESGSGKSMSALAILRLLPWPSVQLEGGQILWRGTDLLTASESRLEQLRGGEIAMIFQEPMTALNPVYTIGTQIAEVLGIHGRARGRAARKRAVELLSLVGIPEPALRAESFPHELSGGMRQRALIAMALACEPKLLIADEPTTALDVTVQAQILDLLARLQQELHMSTLFITHDLGVVAQVASSVVVLYAGRVVETAPVTDLFATPRHPYSLGLLSSIPNRANAPVGPHRLRAIPGNPHALGELQNACRFASRCEIRLQSIASHPLCTEREPALIPLGAQRATRCHYYTEIEDRG
ncbi:MAG TPA: ABC transporter ATP-binding protein [Polyangiaceae bacterium]|nr:ABC transporter ATP-binding protein [Polyangiaceae bacterium]